MTVIIVGGGIGGLVTALQLHQRGVACEVYERDEEAHDLGVGISMLPWAVDELTRLGLLDELRAISVEAIALYYVHRLGGTIAYRPCGVESRVDARQFCLPRGPLLRMLLDAVRTRLGEDKVHTGHRLDNFQQFPNSNSVQARFVDAHGRLSALVSGALLVGADGIHSAVRAQLFPDEGPPPRSGLRLFHGVVEAPAFASGHAVVVAGGIGADTQGCRLVAYPIGDGIRPGRRLINWLIAVPADQPGDVAPSQEQRPTPVDLAEVLPHLERFRLPQLDHAGMVLATAQILDMPACDRDPLPRWSRGRVTLLGDAAHAMPPLSAVGAAQAILDASCLAACVDKHGETEQALGTYSAQRRPATSLLLAAIRGGGPEQVIDEVERLAPQGFDRIEAVADPVLLQMRIEDYVRTTASAWARPWAEPATAG